MPRMGDPTVITDHGDLDGLTDDDHTKYLKEKAFGGLITEIPDIGDGHVTKVPLAYDSIGQGSWVPLDYAEMWSEWPLHSVSNADGDNISYKATLAAGTYTLLVLMDTGSARGILDVDIDGEEVASFDCYSAAAVFNVRNVETGIVISEAGEKTIRLRVDGKHANSSAHQVIVASLSLWRTT